MKLVDVLEMKLRIESMQLADKEHTINNHLRHLRDILGSNLLEDDSINRVSKSHDRILDELATMRAQIIQQKTFLENFIQDKHEEYFEQSRKIYESMQNDSAEYIFERHKTADLFDNDSARDLFISRLGQYVSWQKPGLEIHPVYGAITDHIKGCDPLYLVDTSDEMLFYCKTKWNEKYQRRLRYYHCNDSNETPITGLPKKQFGLVVSVNFFNYKTIEIITNYLRLVFDLLCPGGVFVFTYNNCSLPRCVELVDRFFNTYVPKEVLLEIVEKIGYEVIEAIDANGTTSWLEIKKPGHIKTIRGGQTLAQIRTILDKNVAEYPSGDDFPAKPIDGEIFVRTDGNRTRKFQYNNHKGEWIQLKD